MGELRPVEGRPRLRSRSTTTTTTKELPSPLQPPTVGVRRGRTDWGLSTPCSLAREKERSTGWERKGNAAVVVGVHPCGLPASEFRPPAGIADAPVDRHVEGGRRQASDSERPSLLTASC
jgi:hypothetical protein